jgi:RNA exonuclease 1
MCWRTHLTPGQDKDPSVLHARAPFAHTASISTTTTPTPACALDCEMIYTTSGMSLARVTILGIDGQTVLLDEFIDPHPAAVLDYNTRFSGISEKELKAKAVLNMAGLHRALGSILHPKTLIIGHGALRYFQKTDTHADQASTTT